MGIRDKLKDINDADLSRLAQRINDLIPEIDRPAANGPAEPTRIDEAWVRQNIVPLLEKIGRLRK